MGMTLGLLDEAVTESVCDSLAAPEPMPERLTVWSVPFSLIETFAREFNVGGWFTGLTVTLNVRVTVALAVPPSFTVTVIVAVPDIKVTGAKLREPVAFGLV